MVEGELVSDTRSAMRRREDLIFDVGMHRGEDTDFYLKKGFDVVSFEANPDLVGSCEARFKDAISDGKLNIVSGVLAPPGTGESIAFYRNARSEWGTIDPEWAVRNQKLGYTSEVIQLKRIDLDGVISKYGMPYYMKIDVEGVDGYILDTIASTALRPQYISIESNKSDIDALDGEIDRFSKLGYKKFKIVQQGNIPGTEIATSRLDGQSLRHTFETHSSGPFGEDITLPWLSAAEARAAYRDIFRRYKFFGDNTFYERLPKPARKVIANSYRALTGYRGPLPGWFDTHASL